MFRLLVTICLISLAFSATLPEPRLSGRIVGGSTATQGQFPYAVSLRTTANSHFCAGTLISTTWIVSAAHCTNNRAATSVRAVVGSLHRVNGGDTYAVRRIVNHPRYNSSSLLEDISVVETSTEVVLSSNVAPAELGSAFVGGGVNVVASGWGRTVTGGSAADNLQFIALTTLTNSDCQSRFSESNAARIREGCICTFTRSGEGTCNGDSGGPLALGNTLVGAVSWGIACARGFPDVYARVSHYRSWILEVIGN